MIVNEKGICMNKCIICNQPKKMCISHIIPQGFYTKIKETSNDKCVLIVEKNKPLRTKAKGFKGNIGICIDCDNKIGLFDEYALNFLYSDFSKYKKTIKDISYFDIPNSEFDYKKLKTFFVSVLWRASLSNNKFFQMVSLGDKYNNLCLKYIKNEIEDIPEIRIAITRIKSNIIDDKIMDLMMPFAAGRTEEGYCWYTVIFGKHKIMFTIDQRQKNLDFQITELNKDKNLLIVQTDFEEHTGDFSHFANIVNSHKKRQT
jgi:hypothetical protein